MSFQVVWRKSERWGEGEEGCFDPLPPAGVLIVCILRGCGGLWCEGNSLLPFRENPWIEGEGERGDNEQEIVQWGLFKQ